MLRTVERKILSYLKTSYRGSYIDIGSVVGSSDKIWTLSLNQQSTETPIVLLHGLGAGVALWVFNLDSLAKHRPVYAIDLLGNLSRRGWSRCVSHICLFIITSVNFIQALEEAADRISAAMPKKPRINWFDRLSHGGETQLDKFVLLGHSMGGFLAASYAIKHPEHVKHLILADPWGFPEKPSEVVQKRNIPLWVKAIAYVVQPLNPLWAVRFAGPFGQWLIETTRPDIIRKFSPILKEEPSLISQYIHQCNAQTPSPSSSSPRASSPSASAPMSPTRCSTVSHYRWCGARDSISIMLDHLSRTDRVNCRQEAAALGGAAEELEARLVVLELGGARVVRREQQQQRQKQSLEQADLRLVLGADRRHRVRELARGPSGAAPATARAAASAAADRAYGQRRRGLLRLRPAADSVAVRVAGRLRLGQMAGQHRADGQLAGRADDRLDQWHPRERLRLRRDVQELGEALERRPERLPAQSPAGQHQRRRHLPHVQVRHGRPQPRRHEDTAALGLRRVQLDDKQVERRQRDRTSGRLLVQRGSYYPIRAPAERRRVEAVAPRRAHPLERPLPRPRHLAAGPAALHLPGYPHEPREQKPNDRAGDRPNGLEHGGRLRLHRLGVSSARRGRGPAGQRRAAGQRRRLAPVHALRLPHVRLGHRPARHTPAARAKPRRRRPGPGDLAAQGQRRQLLVRLARHRRLDSGLSAHLRGQRRQHGHGRHRHRRPSPQVAAPAHYPRDCAFEIDECDWINGRESSVGGGGGGDSLDPLPIGAGSAGSPSAGSHHSSGRNRVNWERVSQQSLNSRHHRKPHTLTTTRPRQEYFMSLQSNSRGGSSASAYLVSSDIKSSHRSNSEPLCLSFWYLMFESFIDAAGPSLGVLRLLVQPVGDGIDSALPLWQLYNNQGPSWQYGQVTIGPEKRDYSIVFEGTWGPNRANGNIAIDDIAFYTGNCSVKPSSASVRPQDCSFEKGLCGWENQTSPSSGKNDPRLQWQRAYPSHRPAQLLDKTFSSPGDFVFFDIFSPNQRREVKLRSPLVQSSAAQEPSCFTFWFVAFGVEESTELKIVLMSPNDDVDANDSQEPSGEFDDSEQVLWSLTAKGFNNPKPLWTWAQVTIEPRSSYRLILQGSASNGGFAIDDIKFQSQACPSNYYTRAFFLAN
ncbi:unnamed protein product [Trichogramma brassicae]|uniref:MAM domain-containing protein n=1 Tax=Trichogramma brassicae TaxID=86971 RepID=A0A6H5HW40_9HYME|nr:unnamed protein product [Trichogramma brassicae]